MAVPYHTHSFEIPSATRDEIEAGVRADVAATPASLGSAAAKDVSYFATSSQGSKADTAVQPTLVLTAGEGLAGGGTLADNINFALSSTSLASLALANSAVQSINGKSGTAVLLTAADISAVPDTLITDINANTAARHTHANKSILDAVTAAYTTAEANKLAGIAAGAQVNTVISVAGKTGAVVLNASDVGSAPDTLVPDITANTSARHSHTNKAILDATTASFLTDEKTKLAGIATGATANTGTVTSIGIAAPTGLSASAPITTSGNITISYTAGYTGYTTAEKTKLAGIPADADKTPSLAAVALSGDYSDLGGRPTLGALAVKDSIAVADLSASGTPSSATFLRGDNTWGTVAGAGTVTSVGLSAPTGFTVAGSPVTGAGTLTFAYASGYQGYTTAEADKLDGVAAGAQVNTVTSVAGKTGAITLAKADVGLGNVDNTSDANKPVSTAQQAAIQSTQQEIAATKNTMLGHGQTWQDVKASRLHNTSYQNTSGKPIQVMIGGQNSGFGLLQLSDDGVNWAFVATYNGATEKVAQIIIPEQCFYRITVALTKGDWMELR